MPAYRTRDTQQQQRSLEVTTDVPLPPPTLAIISPTPRAFTFASAHNLDDSPYSSPSHTPFEPDLRPLFISSTTTPPPSSSTPTILSPTTSVQSGSPSPSSNHKRRKSSTSCDAAERRPKKGDDDYIKRPENAFILFRRKCCEERQAAAEDASADPNNKTKKQRQADLSKTISQQWKGLSAEEKQRWEDLAKEKKKEHAELYPDYVYRPQRARDKDGRPKPRKTKAKKTTADTKEAEHEETLSFAVPLARHGRSASAPTPSPISTQIIQVPSLYIAPSPSCPTSPSLLPMIARRASHPDDSISSHYDFSNNHLMPMSFGQAGLFEASLQQSPEYYSSMFNAPPSCMQTFSLSQHTTLLPAQEIVVSPCTSIASGSSGPPSPHCGPFTPSHLAPHSFAHSQLELIDPLQYSQEGQDQDSQLSSQFQSELDMGMDEMQQQFHGYTWENNSVWQTGAESLDPSDFNLDMLPIASFDNLKGNEELTITIEPHEMSSSSQEQYQLGYYGDHTQQSDSLLQYDEMMVSY